MPCDYVPTIGQLVKIVNNVQLLKSSDFMFDEDDDIYDLADGIASRAAKDSLVSNVLAFVKEWSQVKGVSVLHKIAMEDLFVDEWKVCRWMCIFVFSLTMFVFLVAGSGLRVLFEQENLGSLEG
jgi:hypothetical protein